MHEIALELNNVCKTFRVAGSPEAQGRRVALSNINLKLLSGEIYGFAGINGAGKTTTIKTSMGLISPDSGYVEFFGEPLNSLSLSKIGFCPEKQLLYDTLTASETLDYAAALLGVNVGNERKKAVLEKTGLYQDRNKRVSAFSKGMQQRLGIACAILHEPDLYILDEPASGLDPVGRRMLKGIMKELKESQKTVFFSTHIIADIMELCDRIAVIHRGQILFEGKTAEFCKNSQDGEAVFVKMIENFDREHSTAA